MSIKYEDVWRNLNDISDKVMRANNIIEDIDLLLTEVCDGPKEMTEDQIANILIGLKSIYEIRFRNIHDYIERSFEELSPNDPISIDNIDELMSRAHRESVS